jgi:tellurite resistance-related uncharacterized protein
VRRQVVGWHTDDVGDWVAELSCLHGQHVRHQPPFRLTPWVTSEAGRHDHLGIDLDCPACDRTELPDGLVVLRTTAIWDETTMPRALTRRHRVAAARWGQLRVVEGDLAFWAATTPELDRTVSAGEVQAIPPEVDHHVVVVGPVKLCIDFLGKVEDAS